MQVFSVFFKVLKKKLPSSIIYLVVYIIIAFTFVYTAKEPVSFEAKRLNVAVFDKDLSDESRALTDYIATRHDIVKIDLDRDRLMDALYYGALDYAFVIKKGYAKSIGDGDFDGLFINYKLHDSYDALLMEQFLGEYTSALRTYMATGESPKSAISKTEKLLDKETEVSYVGQDENDAKEFPENIAFFYQYLPYVLICALINSICPVLIAMRRKDIRYRTNCSPLKVSSSTIQTVLASSLYVLILWLIFVVIGCILYGGMYSGRAWYAVLNSAVFALIVTMFAVLVANLTTKQETVNIIAQIVGLGMSFLCGVFVPQYLLGEGVLRAAHFLPAYWYIKANNMLSGTDVYNPHDVMVCLFIELGFAVALGALALAVNRIIYQGGVRRNYGKIV